MNGGESFAIPPAVEACTRERAGIVRNNGRGGRSAPPQTPPSPTTTGRPPPRTPNGARPPPSHRRRRPSTAGTMRLSVAPSSGGGPADDVGGRCSEGDITGSGMYVESSTVVVDDDEKPPPVVHGAFHESAAGRSEEQEGVWGVPSRASWPATFPRATMAREKPEEARASADLHDAMEATAPRPSQAPPDSQLYAEPTSHGESPFLASAARVPTCAVKQEANYHHTNNNRKLYQRHDCPQAAVPANDHNVRRRPASASPARPMTGSVFGGEHWGGTEDVRPGE